MKTPLGPQPPCTIAHIVLNFMVGGLESLVASLVPRLSSNGLSCVVYCLNSVNDDFHNTTVSRLRHRGIRVVLLKKREGLDPLLALRLSRGLRGVDVVHSHNVGAHIYGSVAGKLAGVPVIVMTRHGEKLKGRFRFFVRVLGRFTDAVICVANRVADDIISVGVAPEKVSVIPNGIDIQQYDVPVKTRQRARHLTNRALGFAEDVRMVGFVGRLVKEKGLPTLLEAFNALCARLENTRLLIIGDGPLRQDLQHYVRRHGLENRVFFLGKRKRPAIWISILDVFVLPSYSEGSPIVLLETLAARIPVVATRVGGIGEIIRDDVNGLLVQPRDSSALESALYELLRDKEKRDRYGQMGHTTVATHHSVDQTAKAHEELYARLLARSNRALIFRS